MEEITKENNLDIKDMTDNDKAEFVFLMVNELKESIKTTTNGYMKTGAILSIIFEEKLYQNYSSDVKTWEEFVAQTCPFKMAMADHLRRIYKTYKDYIGNRSIPITRLVEALPIVNESNMDIILNDAELLPRKAWTDQLRSVKKKTPTDECTHPQEFIQVWNWCTKCNSRIG